MKATFNASIKEHREIAELFRNQPCEFKRSISGDLMGGVFISTMNSPHYPKFVVYRLGDVTTKESITIDLDTAQMDLRMAIGTGIEFVFSQQFVKKGTIYAVSSNGYAHIRSLRNKHIVDLDKIKLCPDYLKSVGVEVEE